MDDPLLTAVAKALREHGVTDPKAVIAAAGAAELVLGRDRCVCRQSVHAAHHRTRVNGCPWCDRAAPRKGVTSTVPTGGLL